MIGGEDNEKRILLIVGGLLSLFILLNIVWFAWRGIKYAPYADSMSPNLFSTFISPRYVLTDEEGYDFSVKYPDYLQLAGNLSVGMPAADDNLFTDALIIWPLATGGCEYGVLLYEENGEGYNIYVDEHGNAIHAADEEAVERHSDNIEQLIAKAQNMWNVL